MYAFANSSGDTNGEIEDGADEGKPQHVHCEKQTYEAIEYSFPRNRDWFFIVFVGSGPSRIRWISPPFAVLEDRPLPEVRGGKQTCVQTD